jgi:hypothetical protein
MVTVIWDSRTGDVHRLKRLLHTPDHCATVVVTNHSGVAACACSTLAWLAEQA